MKNRKKTRMKYGCIHPPPVHRPLRWGYFACFLDKKLCYPFPAKLSKGSQCRALHIHTGITGRLHSFNLVPRFTIKSICSPYLCSPISDRMCLKELLHLSMRIYIDCDRLTCLCIMKACSFITISKRWKEDCTVLD